MLIFLHVSVIKKTNKRAFRVHLNATNNGNNNL